MSERVAVVTGGNRGIGFEIVRQLAARGFRVVLASRDLARGREAQARLGTGRERTEVRPLDVTSEEQARALAASVERTLGRCDVLVNNAGVLLDPKGSRSLDLAPDVLRRTFDVNVLGPVVVTKALVALMRRHGYGRIVNMSSGLGQLADMGVGTPAYRMSKSALNAFTRTLAAEFAGTNIKVNSMCPGWVRTDMGGPHATKSVEEAADTAVWLATLSEDGPTGGFFRDRQPIPW
ncbi:MAG: SDR family oxidoreductase [Burkholderiales bacterium]|nr:SDR family oxidoreductase [Burkholderiales bacterium]